MNPNIFVIGCGFFRELRQVIITTKGGEGEKIMKELKLEELSIEQKLGICMTALISEGSNQKEEIEYAIQMIQNHALGAIWILSSVKEREKIMASVKQAADYPILFISDAEAGIGGHFISRHNALGCADSPELAYVFGKVTAVTARQMGYNVICDPVLDMFRNNVVCGGNVRSLGSDKYKVALLAIAEAQGLHDGGVLTVGKHYPGGKNGTIDPHMAEKLSWETAEELLDDNLYPYLQLIRQGLLDGIMTEHCRFPKIDPDYPASLSEKVIGLIREQGFDGFAITDALVMMGAAAKFGARACKGLAIAGGNDLALVWGSNKEGYEAILECYRQDMIPDERVNEAVKRVLKAQHKTLAEPKYTELTEKELELFDRINLDSIFARTDEGISTALSRQGRHYFVILTEDSLRVSDRDQVDVDTRQRGWYRPYEILDQIKALFPQSMAVTIPQFPSPAQAVRVLEESVEYEDVVFITFLEAQAYVGRECLTSRIVSLIEALQVTDRISTIVHFGNPYVLEELEHIPRVLIGGLCAKSVCYTMEVLAGKYPANGVLTYDVHLK